ncbi:MAG: carbohydrate ABC transporter permease, partial [Steroidobacteraceae bacterium]
MRWTNALYVAPYLTLYAALLIYPLLAALWLSLHKADFFGAQQFAGFENFIRLFGDAVFLRTVWNTFY